MSETTVFRIAHPSIRYKGQPVGPYTVTNALSSDHPLFEKMSALYSLLSSMDYRDRPVPWNDGIDDHSQQHIFGFESLDALFAWFEIGIEEMRELGFELYIYKVYKFDVIKGEKQVCFIPTQNVETMPL